MNYMYKLTVAFSENDNELKEALEKQFGTELKYVRERGFDGWEFLFTVAIPLTEVTIAVVEFVIDHFRNYDKNKTRVLIEPNGKIDLKGYSGEEAERIIKTYFESQAKIKNESGDSN